MPPTYATRANLFALSIPPSVLQDQAREVYSVDATSNRLTLGGHGLDTDAPFQLSSGAAGVLPAPLSASTVYYARPVADSDSLLEVAATPGGAAIDLTTAGTPPFSIVVRLGPAMDQILEYYSRYIDRQMPAHAVPFEAPYPTEVVAICTDLSAAKLLRRLGQSIPVIEEAGRIARGELMTFSKGVPLRDARATATRNRATYYPMTSQRDDGSGTIP